MAGFFFQYRKGGRRKIVGVNNLRNWGEGNSLKTLGYHSTLVPDQSEFFTFNPSISESEFFFLPKPRCDESLAALIYVRVL